MPRRQAARSHARKRAKLGDTYQPLLAEGVFPTQFILCECGIMYDFREPDDHPDCKIALANQPEAVIA